MLRRDFLSLCGLAAGYLPEHCSLWPSSHVTRHSSQPALAGQACLQNRLNELGQNYAIEIRSW
jgi:hypothetical protein